MCELEAHQGCMQLSKRISCCYVMKYPQSPFSLHIALIDKVCLTSAKVSLSQNTEMVHIWCFCT